MADSFISGAAVMAVFFLLVMIFAFYLFRRNMGKVMFADDVSPHDFNTTVKKLKQSIEKQGWKIMGTYDYQKYLIDGNEGDIGHMELIEICVPRIAHKVLTLKNNKPFSVMFPCLFSVYENKDGSVHLASLRVSLFAVLSGGAKGKILHGADAEERTIIERMIADQSK